MTSRTGVLLPENSQASSRPSPAAADQGRVLGVQHHQIGEPARRDRTGVAAERLRATRQRAPGRARSATDAPGCVSVHVARAALQPADVFEPAQLLDRAGADVGIAADAETAALRPGTRAAGRCRRRDWPRWSGTVRRPRRSPPAADVPRHPCASHAPGTSGDRPVHGRAARRPGAHRSTRGSRQPPSPVRRRGYGSAGSRAMSMAAASSAGVTARSECGAMPIGSVRRHGLAQRGIVVERQHEAALRFGRRRAAKLRVAIQHRQQGQADAGAAAPRPRCGARVPPDRHSASRRVRCAGSGIRRPTCSRAAGIRHRAGPRSPRRHPASAPRGSGTSPRASARSCRPRVRRVPARPAIARWNACECRLGMPGTTRPGRRSAGSRDCGVT